MIQGLQDQITTFYRFLKTYNLTDFTGPFNCNTILKKGIFGKDTTIKLKERWGGGGGGGGGGEGWPEKLSLYEM